MAPEHAVDDEQAADETGDLPEEFVAEDAAAEELAAVVLDVLGPVLAWYRTEVARRLDLDAASLACLDLLRRCRRASSALIGERTGLTRSSVSKMVRRLESAGHVERVNRPERGQTTEVALRPYADRDAELARLRLELSRGFRYTVAYRVREREWNAALRVLRAAADRVHLAAAGSADEAAEERRMEARRKAREADPDRWRW